MWSVTVLYYDVIMETMQFLLKKKNHFFPVSFIVLAHNSVPVLVSITCHLNSVFS